MTDLSKYRELKYEDRSLGIYVSIIRSYEDDDMYVISCSGTNPIYDMDGNVISSSRYSDEYYTERQTQSYVDWLETELGCKPIFKVTLEQDQAIMEKYAIEAEERERKYQQELYDKNLQLYSEFIDVIGDSISLKSQPTYEDFEHITKIVMKERGGKSVTMRRMDYNTFRLKGDEGYVQLSADIIYNELMDAGRYGVYTTATFDSPEYLADYIVRHKRDYSKYSKYINGIDFKLLDST